MCRSKGQPAARQPEYYTQSWLMQAHSSNSFLTVPMRPPRQSRVFLFVFESVTAQGERSTRRGAVKAPAAAGWGGRGRQGERKLKSRRLVSQAWSASSTCLVSTTHRAYCVCSSASRPVIASSSRLADSSQRVMMSMRNRLVRHRLVNQPHMHTSASTLAHVSPPAQMHLFDSQHAGFAQVTVRNPLKQNYS